MAYGIEVLDVNGKTVFNSNNPTELVVFISSIDGNTHLAIPDYCYGWDSTSQAEVFPSIYARPTNPSSTVIFTMKSTVDTSSSHYKRGVTIADKNGTNTNTFEIVVAIPAKDWGDVLTSRTTKYTAGSSTYGLESYDSAGDITYSTLSRPTKFSASAGLLPRTQQQSWWLPAAAITPFPILSVSATPYKRYCRMNPTILGRASGVTLLTYHYVWWANHSIGLKWDTIYSPTLTAFDTYTSQQLFGLVDFGDSM